MTMKMKRYMDHQQDAQDGDVQGPVQRTGLFVFAHEVGHGDDKADLDELRRLDTDTGEAYPRLVAAAGVAQPMEGEDQKQANNGQEAPAGGEDVDIHQGEEEVEKKPDDKSADLDIERAHRVVVPDGAGDQHHAVNGGQETKRQKKRVRALEIPFRGVKKFFHVIHQSERNNIGSLCNQIGRISAYADILPHSGEKVKRVKGKIPFL